MFAEMQQGSRWIGENVAKFTALWFVVLLLAALLIPGEARFPIPHSILGIVSLPLTLVVLVFVAAFAAFVALVFFGPVLALWLAIYLVVIFGLGRALSSDRTARLACVLVAPVLWVPFFHSGDHLVNDVSLAITCLYGFLVRPWPAKGFPSPTARDVHTA